VAQKVQKVATTNCSKNRIKDCQWD